MQQATFLFTSLISRTQGGAGASLEAGVGAGLTLGVQAWGNGHKYRFGGGVFGGLFLYTLPSMYGNLLLEHDVGQEDGWVARYGLDLHLLGLGGIMDSGSGAIPIPFPSVTFYRRN